MLRELAEIECVPKILTDDVLYRNGLDFSELVSDVNQCLIFSSLGKS